MQKQNKKTKQKLTFRNWSFIRDVCTGWADETAGIERTAAADETAATDETAAVDKRAAADETAAVDETAGIDKTAGVEKTAGGEDTVAGKKTPVAEDTVGLGEMGKVGSDGRWRDIGNVRGLRFRKNEFLRWGKS
jgi:UDP-3-O-[3-hydroxymyristoyl] glucosamine N-acyltransferase